MSNVNDWAREQAEKRYPATWQDRGRTDRDDERDAFKEGVSALADALLSDEAIQAAKVAGFHALDGAEQIEDVAGNIWDIGDAISDALQAAVDAATKEARSD